MNAYQCVECKLLYSRGSKCPRCGRAPRWINTVPREGLHLVRLMGCGCWVRGDVFVSCGRHAEAPPEEPTDARAAEYLAKLLFTR